MANLQQQISALFDDCDDDVREVIEQVLRYEQENVHLLRPNYKQPYLDILDRVIRTMHKDATHEA